MMDCCETLVFAGGDGLVCWRSGHIFRYMQSSMSLPTEVLSSVPLLVQRLLFARQVGRAIAQRITEYSTTEGFTDSTDSQ